jgi:hypothetical protein
MIITPIDKKHNLFSVKNAYSNELINKIQNLDIMSYQRLKVGGQEERSRYLLQWDDTDVFARFNAETTENLLIISKNIGIELKEAFTNVWVDYNQFTMSIHEDNPSVSVAMQIYLLPNDINIGTKFYYHNTDDSLRYDFPYTVNTGYIMINEPGQYHGVPFAAPIGSIRCSSYTHLFKSTV